MALNARTTCVASWTMNSAQIGELSALPTFERSQHNLN